MPKSQEIHQETLTKQGFLLIDKPAGITSHDVVDRVRRLTGERRVGHAGTLDPFATGLLIVGVGRVATREMEKLVELDKEYEAVFVLGASSTTDDTEGVITSEPVVWSSDAINQFIGEIEQIPPTYSAIKVEGKKMYDAAREGKPIEGKARKVTVYSFEFEIPPLASLGRDDINTTRLKVQIRCSSGTYIRALARDLGKVLGGGGYVEELRRTHIEPFSINQASTLESLEGRVESAIIPVQTLLASL
ncbi:tRNA pseudouridine(55) synthase TruB [Candidatus Uhrbacteria bacterium]|nr:tRNA pseudouridine(55) synthase TruB [Candidatus Uhrbacteria bacterium]